MKMKTHSRILRGYNENKNAIDRSSERHMAPSSQRNNGMKKNNIFIALSDPLKYKLPKVSYKHR